MERQAAAAERAEQDRLLLKGSGVWNRRPEAMRGHRTRQRKITDAAPGSLPLGELRVELRPTAGGA
jgi:hypothetical protein